MADLSEYCLDGIVGGKVEDDEFTTGRTTAIELSQS